MQEAAEFDKILEAYTRGGVSRESVYGGTSTMRQYASALNLNQQLPFSLLSVRLSEWK